MTVTLVIPAELGRYCDGNESQPSLGTTVFEAVDDLAARFPDVKLRLQDGSGKLHPYFMVIHNGRIVPAGELEAVRLRDGDRVELLSIASGG